MIEQPRWRQSQRRRKATKGKRGKTRGARGQTGTYFPRVQGSPCPLSAAPPDTLPLSSPLLSSSHPSARIPPRGSSLFSLPFLFYFSFIFFFSFTLDSVVFATPLAVSRNASARVPRSAGYIIIPVVPRLCFLANGIVVLWDSGRVSP